MLNKILFVGEQFKQAERVGSLIERAFLNVEFSHSFPDGDWLKCVEREEPSLLFLSAQPQSERDLFETCCLLDSQGGVSRVSVILVVSTFVTPTDRIKAFQAGAFGILPQSLTEQELLPLLAFTLPLKSQRFQHDERMNRDPDLVEEWETRIRFQLIFDYSPDNIMLLDGFGQILDANLSTCQLMGMPSKNFDTQKVSALREGCD
jgi:CheY-like chemotaxis protein